MSLANVLLIAVDMDGTLLTPTHEVSPEFWSLHQQILAAGITFAAASGRQYDSILDKLSPIQDTLVVIAENGAYAVADGEIFVKTVLPKGALHTVLARLERLPDINVVVCTPDQAYVRNDRPDFVGFMSEYYSSHRCVEELAALDVEILKLALYHPVDSEQHTYPHFADLEPELKVKVSGKFWVDISHPDAHKGYALAILQERLGIGPDQTLAIGDYNNDLEMLARADYSYAMANSHPNVQAAARFTTGSNAEAGVEAVLRDVLAALAAVI